MNEHDESVQPSAAETCPTPEILLESPKPKPLSWWLRKLFACNPFYLVSAALLLFGCYRVSMDAPFLSVESARLLFNFSSVQIYEVLLVFTAIFLARHCLWYDSTLLVGLENLLVFVPFILISQAALIDSQMALATSLAGGTIAVMRFGSLKQFLTELNLPGRLLVPGFILLALNVSLPLIYRHFGETKIGVHIDSGPAYVMNECTWLLILPAVLALANFLPHARATGDLLPQHRWLPTGLFTLWIAVTGVHLYSLDYIYQFDLRSELFAPAAWVLGWTVWLQIADHSTLWLRRLKYALVLPPVLVPLLATSPGGGKTFLTLAALNIIACCAICCLKRDYLLARHLLFVSVMFAVAGLPPTWLQALAPGFSHITCIGSAVMAYLISWTLLSRNPKLAILGAVVLGTAVMTLFGQHAGAGNWAFQSSLVFLLLHSLRWNDGEQAGANIVREVAGSFWVLQTFFWVNSEAAKFWMPFIPGLIVLGAYTAVCMLRGRWNHLSLPVKAALVILSGPGSATVEGVRTMPVGLLAVIGSFLLFGLGTATALTRHHWHKKENLTQLKSTETTDPVS